MAGIGSTHKNSRVVVNAAVFLCSLPGNRFNLHQGTPGQGTHRNGRPGWRIDGKPPAINIIHDGEICKIHQVYGCLDDISAIETSSLQQ